MSLSVIASSAWAFSASTTTAAAPALPTGWAAGDLLLLAVTWKQDTATLTTPTGWTLLTSQSGGTGAAAGAGVGNVVTAYLSKTAASGETAPTIAALTGGGTANTTGNVMGATITAYRATTKFYDLATFKGGQNTSATAWAPAGALTAATGTGNTNTLAVNDIIEAVHGMSLSTTTQTLHTFTATGLTVGTRTVTPTKGASTTGADLGATRFHATVSATTAAAGATITASATQSAATYGSMVGVRVREAQPRVDVAVSGSGTLTATPGVSALIDDMSTLTNWGFNAGDLFAVNNGNIRITETQSSVTPGQYPTTTTDYSMADSWFVFRVSAASFVNASGYFVGLDDFSTADYFGLQFTSSTTGTLWASNGESVAVDLATKPWHAVAHRNGRLYVYNSADGVTWTELGRSSFAFPTPSAGAFVIASWTGLSFGTATPGDVFEVGDLNTGYGALPWEAKPSGSGTLAAVGLQLNAFSGSGTLTATGVGQYVATGNLYRDPSIEAGDGSDWAQHVGNVNFPGRATWSAVTVGDAVDGTQVLRATITTAGTFALNAPLVAGVATHAWSESFYIRQTAGTFRAHQVGLTYYDSAGTILTQAVTNMATLTGAFVRYSANTGSRADLPTTAFVAARHVVTSAAVGDVFEYDLVQVVGASSGTTVGGGAGPQALSGSGSLTATGVVAYSASTFVDDMSTLTNWNFAAGDAFAQSGGAIRTTYNGDLDTGRNPYTDRTYLLRDSYFVFEVPARSISGNLSVGMWSAPVTGGAGGYGYIGFRFGTSPAVAYGSTLTAATLTGATWFAVRSVGTQLTFYASADSVTWTTLDTLTYVKPPNSSLDTPLGFFFGAPQAGEAVVGDWIEVNNINTGYTRLPWQAVLSGSGTLSALGTQVGGTNFTGTAALSGSGALTAIGTPKGTGAASPSGSGTLTVTGSPQPIIAVTLSGSGTTTTAGLVVSSAAPTGSGTVTATGKPTIPGTASPSGSGTATATGIVLGAAALSGSGATTTAGKPGLTGTANPTGSGVLSATGAPGYIGTAAFTSAIAGDGTGAGLSFTPPVTTPNLRATTATSGDGHITAPTAHPTFVRPYSESPFYRLLNVEVLPGDSYYLEADFLPPVDYAGGGVLNLRIVSQDTAYTDVTASADNSDWWSWAEDATILSFPNAPFTMGVFITPGQSSYDTAIADGERGALLMYSSGVAVTLTDVRWTPVRLTGFPGVRATAAATGSGTLTATGTVAGKAAPTGSGTTTTAGKPGLTGTAAATGSGTLTTSNPIVIASTSLSGDGTLVALQNRAVDVSGSGSVTTVGKPILTTTATLSGSGTATAVGLARFTDSVQLTGSGTLAATGVTAITGATATPNGSGTTTTAGKPAIPTTAAPNGTGTLTCVGSPSVARSLPLSGSGLLVALATPGIDATAIFSGSSSSTTTSVPNLTATAAPNGSGSTSTTATVIATSSPSGSGTATATGAANLSGSGSSTGSGTGSASGAPAFVDARNLFGSGTAVTTNANPKLTDSISFSALGVLAASGTPTIATTASPSGIGQVLAATAATTTGSANPTGSGTLAGQAIKVTATGTATLSGSGSDVAAGTPNFAGTCATSGSGSTTGTGTPAVVASAAASGSGTTSVVSRVSFTGTANLSGSGLLSAVGSSDTSGAANTSGSGTLVGSGTASIASTATFTGTGTVTTAGTPAIPSSASLSGSGATTTAATVLTSANASGTGTTSTSAGKPTFAIQAATSGSGTLVASAAVSSTVSLTGSGSLTGAGTPTVTVSAAATGLGNLSAAGATTGSTGTAQATGSGSLGATPVAVTTADSVTLSGSGAVAAATKPNTSDIAHFTGSGTLSAAPVANFTGATAALSGDGSLAAAGKAIFTTTATLTGSGALTTTAALANPIVTPPLTGSGTLTASGGVSTKGVATLTSEGTLTTTVVVSFATSADLSGDSQLTLATRAAFRDITATAVPRTTWSADARLAARNAVLRATGRAAEARLNTPEAAPRNAWTARSHLEH